ncbi:hypothetical protein RIF29_27136 [Crotalaria pallida]|uniref:Uncharacterized protein n=1 Tax=Crotalaria pallida TaxID=3830 RepID=A0AAN9EVR7_CROPI
MAPTTSFDEAKFPLCKRIYPFVSLPIYEQLRGYRDVLGGNKAELLIKVGVSIGWLQYSWNWFWEFSKESSDHYTLLRSSYCWRLPSNPNITL